MNAPNLSASNPACKLEYDSDSASAARIKAITDLGGVVVDFRRGPDGRTITTVHGRQDHPAVVDLLKRWPS